MNQNDPNENISESNDQNGSETPDTPVTNIGDSGSTLEAQGDSSVNMDMTNAGGEPVDTVGTTVGIAFERGTLAMEVTRGRVVYYTPGSDDRELYGKKALTAHVAEAYPTGKVNLAVLDTNGRWYQRTNVDFLQPSDPIPDTSYAEWMPYQKAQLAAL